MKKVTPDMVNEWLSQSICLSPIHPTYVHTMSKETFLFAFKDEVYPKSKEKRVEIAKYSEDGYLGIFGQNRCYLLRDKDFILPIH